MRNIIGKPVSGGDYFKRATLIKRIYRRLDTGSDIYLSAPRRVGKTSTMQYLKSNPRAGFSFLLINTEPIKSTEAFFKKLLNELLNHPAITTASKRSTKVKQLLETVTKRVKKIGVFDVEIELDHTATETYSDVFSQLLRELETENQQIVVMIDEFPSTVENIRQEQGDNAAINFLKLNRAIRQTASLANTQRIQFLYTGSIGLSPLVNHLSVPESINDLDTVEIEPLTHEEGRLFAQKLLNYAQVEFTEIQVIDHLLNKIRWLMPFFIQLAVQELIDQYDRHEQPIDKNIVDKAFENTCSRRNNAHFDSYYKRLKKSLPAKEYKVAIKILNRIAAADEVAEKDILRMRKEKQLLTAVLEKLDYDGYIHSIEGIYRFNSPILQRWWNKYIRE